ncbi:hypothetical protein JCM10212_003163 [Sporobolomyces blumeae]
MNYPYSGPNLEPSQPASFETSQPPTSPRGASAPYHVASTVHPSPTTSSSVPHPHAPPQHPPAQPPLHPSYHPHESFPHLHTPSPELQGRRGFLRSWTGGYWHPSRPLPHIAYGPPTNVAPDPSLGPYYGRRHGRGGFQRGFYRRGRFLRALLVGGIGIWAYKKLSNRISHVEVDVESARRDNGNGGTISGGGRGAAVAARPDGPFARSMDPLIPTPAVCDERSRHWGWHARWHDRREVEKDRIDEIERKMQVWQDALSRERGAKQADESTRI